MKKSTAAVFAFSVLSAIPGSANAAAEVISAENVIEHSAQFSVGLTTWLVFFGIAFLLFLLSLMRLPVDEAPEFCGLTSFMLFGLCGLCIPYIGHTQYLTDTVVSNTTTGEIVQVVTPIIISEGNWFLTAACIMMLFISLVNAWRIVMQRVEKAGPKERRERRREELLDRWR